MSKRAAIALGSNLVYRLGNLRKARDQIQALDGVTGLMVQSALYETSPVDCEPGAENFYNVVIEIGFDKSAEELLASLQMIEQTLGRERSHQHNVSRTIDLDLLIFKDARSDTEFLKLPHPRIAARRFVLVPLAELVPNLVHPVIGKPISELLAQTSDSSSVVRWLSPVRHFPL